MFALRAVTLLQINLCPNLTQTAVMGFFDLILSGGRGLLLIMSEVNSLRLSQDIWIHVEYFGFVCHVFSLNDDMSLTFF